jgi:hypothetical protein
MPKSDTPTRTLLEREKSRLHDKMINTWHTLCDTVSQFHALEDHYDLHDYTIELVDGWTGNINNELHKVGYMIEELEDWAFDGNSHVLMEDAE